MSLDLHERVKKIGKFPNVIQIFPSLALHTALADERRAHELATDGPMGPLDAAAGDLTYHGGPTIIGNAQLLNVYLGKVTFDTGGFDAFSQAICENGYYLSPDGKDSSAGKFIGSMHKDWPFQSMTVDDTLIEAYVDGLAMPSTYTPDTMISLIMPPGSTVTMHGQASCSAFCGYHSMTAHGRYYQVICDSSCAGCNPGNPDDGRMMIQAHEYAEWRSDPQGTAWYNTATGMENADECAWQRTAWGDVSNGNWFVQPFWVNGKNCYVGPFTPSPSPQPPPPPPPSPPPPAPVSTAMRMAIEPTDSQVGVPMFTVAVRLLDGAGNPTNDSTTVVTVVLQDANQKYTSPPPAKAVNGVATFPGITPHSTHSGLYYVFTAPGLSGVTSAKFNITAPPPPAGKRSITLTELDGSTHVFLEQ